MPAEPKKPVEIVVAIGSTLLADDIVATLRDDVAVERIRRALVDHAAPDLECVMVAPGYTGAGGRLAYHGIDGFFEAWREWVDAYETYTIEIEEVIEGPDGRVLNLARQRGTTRTGGVEVEEEAGAVWTIRDGRVVKVEFHLDRDMARRAAGLGE
ncbi:MAG TPA: nuclear transport factor 2 family protein [Solirubrobacterales bacterium]|nr:nuclear transport factor 2 family protein [Solirubrobacterales bacterium]